MPALGSSLLASLCCRSDLRLRKSHRRTRAHSAESETEGSPAFCSRTTVLLLTHLEGLQGPAVGGRGLRQEAPLARAGRGPPGLQRPMAPSRGRRLVQGWPPGPCM